MRSILPSSSPRFVRAALRVAAGPAVAHADVQHAVGTERRGRRRCGWRTAGRSSSTVRASSPTSNVPSASTGYSAIVGVAVVVGVVDVRQRRRSASNARPSRPCSPPAVVRSVDVEHGRRGSSPPTRCDRAALLDDVQGVVAGAPGEVDRRVERADLGRARRPGRRRGRRRRGRSSRAGGGVVAGAGVAAVVAGVGRRRRSARRRGRSPSVAGADGVVAPMRRRRVVGVVVAARHRDRPPRTTASRAPARLIARRPGPGPPARRSRRAGRRR